MCAHVNGHVWRMCIYVNTTCMENVRTCEYHMYVHTCPHVITLGIVIVAM